MTAADEGPREITWMQVAETAERVLVTSAAWRVRLATMSGTAPLCSSAATAPAPTET